MPGGKSPVRRPKAALAPIEYRLELTRRSVVSMTTAAIIAGFLIFVAGLVLGVRMNLEMVADEPIAEAAEAGGDGQAAAGDSLADNDALEREDPERSSLASNGQVPGGVVPSPNSLHAGSGILSAGGSTPPPSRMAPDPPRTSLPLPAAAPSALRSTASTPSPAAVPTEMADRAGDGTYLLQVGAFRSLDNAHGLRDRLGRQGYEISIRETSGGSAGPIHRVFIGEYTTRPDAERAAERFRTDTGLEVYVMTERELTS